MSQQVGGFTELQMYREGWIVDRVVLMFRCNTLAMGQTQLREENEEAKTAPEQHSARSSLLRSVVAELVARGHRQEALELDRPQNDRVAKIELNSGQRREKKSKSKSERE